MLPCSKNLLLLLRLFFFFLLPVLVSGDFSPSSSLGVTLARGSGPARPDRAVSFLLKTFPGLTRVRITDPHPDTIRAFSYSGISLLLSVPNALLPAFAANQSNTIRWLSDHVVPFYPRARISAISVGHEVLSSSDRDLSKCLLPAIENLYASLRELGMLRISVSTTHSFDIVKNPFPPSAAQFYESVPKSIIKPLMHFLSTTNSSFLVNLYPYHLYRSSLNIPVGFALFQDHQPFNYRDDLLTGLRYRNVFDVMVDAVISAMGALGQKNISVVVTETGWPSDGDVSEPEANALNAWTYNSGLVSHLKSGLGTPLRRQGVAEAYIYELFDQDRKHGPRSARHWGIVYHNMTRKYEIDFSGSDAGVGVEAGLIEVVLVFWFMSMILQRRI